MSTTAADKYACTTMKVVPLRFKWKIENVLFCLADNKNDLKSPNFFHDDYNKIVWSIELKKGYQNNYNIYIRLVSCISDVRAAYTFVAMNSGDQKSCVPTLFTRGYASYLESFLTFEKLLNDSDLTILCELKFKADNVHLSDLMINVPEYNLHENVEKLFDKKFSDVMIVVGEYEFPAHKALLAARSHEFAAMFKYDSRLNRVTITDVNHEVFKELLDFIYTGKAPNLDKMAGDLFAAADKYALEGLKAMCLNFLFNNLSVAAALKSLVLADLHSVPRLKQKAVSFITANVDEIVKTEDWKDLTKTHSHLISELFVYACSN